MVCPLALRPGAGYHCLHAGSVPGAPTGGLGNANSAQIQDSPPPLREAPTGGWEMQFRLIIPAANTSTNYATFPNYVRLRDLLMLPEP